MFFCCPNENIEFLFKIFGIIFVDLMKFKKRIDVSWVCVSVWVVVDFIVEYSLFGFTLCFKLFIYTE